MPVQERSIPEVQDACAAISADLEALAHHLVRLREALRLPPDTLAIYEDENVPWPVELELDAGHRHGDR